MVIAQLIHDFAKDWKLTGELKILSNTRVNCLYIIYPTNLGGYKHGGLNIKLVPFFSCNYVINHKRQQRSLLNSVYVCGKIQYAIRIHAR